MEPGLHDHILLFAQILQERCAYRWQAPKASGVCHSSVSPTREFGSTRRNSAAGQRDNNDPVSGYDTIGPHPLTENSRIQQIVQTTYHAVQVAADPTKSVEKIEHELANIAPQVGQCIKDNAKHIPETSVQNL